MSAYDANPALHETAPAAERPVSARRKLTGIQFLRAFAAIAVVMHHVAAQIRSNTGYDLMLSLEGLGDQGVELFFTISGFIIFFAHSSDMGRPERLRIYLPKRVLRILPSTIIVATGWAGIAYAARQAGFDAPRIDWSTWISSAFVLPMLDQTSPIVIWSLRHEFLFYAIFAVFLVNLRLGVAVFALWMGLSIVVTIPGDLIFAQTDIFARTLFSDRNVLFAFGACAFLALNKIAFRPHPASFPVLLFLLCAAIYIDGRYHEVSHYLIGVICGLLVWVAAQTDLRGALGRTSEFLGDASYAIYLVHMPVIAIVFPLMSASGLPLNAIYLLETVISILVGAVFFMFVERPLTKVTSRWLRARREPAA